MIEGAKATVVLVPGLANNSRVWAAQVEHLSTDHEIHVADYSGSQTIDEMAERVLAQTRTESFALVGFSLGGYVALRMAGCAGKRIDRLALISSSPYADSEKAVQNREWMISKAMQDYGSVLEDMSKFAVLAEGPHAQHARDVLTKMGRELGVDEFCRQQRAAMRRADSRNLLSSIRCPVQVLCGYEDRVTPVSGSRYLAENISGAALEIIHGAGHLLPLERPIEVNRFLRRWLQ